AESKSQIRNVIFGKGWNRPYDPGDPLLRHAFSHRRKAGINWPFFIASLFVNGLNCFPLLISKASDFGEIEMRASGILNHAIFQTILRIALFENRSLKFLKRFF